MLRESLRFDLFLALGLLLTLLALLLRDLELLLFLSWDGDFLIICELDLLVLPKLFLRATKFLYDISCDFLRFGGIRVSIVLRLFF